jgi:hypothetical protein
MENNYYKLTSSLGKFRAIRVDEVGKEGIYAEFSNDDINHKFNANIFFNGEIIDWEINRWIFSSHIKGEYDNPSTDFKIEAIDPQGEHIELYNTPYYHEYAMLSEEDVLCTYMDSAKIYCHFSNADEALKFNQLLRSLEYNNSFRRYQDECEITLEVVKTQAKYFKEYYLKYIADCSDKNFMKLIKETVNRAIDIIKEDIDKYKIQD